MIYVALTLTLIKQNYMYSFFNQKLSRNNW